MKYLLVLGFCCDVYRKKPRARIFVDDKLIDEFDVPHQKNNLKIAIENYFLNRHTLKPFSKDNEFLNLKIKNFSSLQFYEIEIEQKKKQLKLRIDVENNDSNSTNGFMTKSTLLTFQLLYFFPYNIKILSHLNTIRMKNIIGKNYAWYRRPNNNLFDIIYNSQWHGKNKQSFISSSTKVLSYHGIGGSGYMQCELVKKYGILIPRSIKSNRYDLNLPLLNYFFNKYKQYEN
jgi:hypothetical protein